MDIKGLLEVTCKTVANMIKGTFVLYVGVMGRNTQQALLLHRVSMCTQLPTCTTFTQARPQTRESVPTPTPTDMHTNIVNVHMDAYIQTLTHTDTHTYTHTHTPRGAITDQ